jgi:hypothetical protein
MKKKKNLREDKPISCENQPPWYSQLLQMDESKRIAAVKAALDRIKRAKPECAKFIEDFGCELVGFIPNVQYTMPDAQEQSLEITFVHDFSQGTLLYWCKQGGFGFFVNAGLDYNAEGLMGFIR